MATVSRQREWQKKQQELGNCVICGRTAKPTRRRDAKRPRGSHCETHALYKNEYYMKRYHAKKAS